MEMLKELRDERLILEYALRERDSEILSLASHAISPHPPELVRHLLTQPSALYANWYMRYGVGRGNYLASEDLIRGILENRRTLSFDVIRGIGFAYLQSCAPLLRKRLGGSLELARAAQHSRGEKVIAGLSSDEMDGWTREGWESLRAAVALARLDAAIDLAHVERLHAEASEIYESLASRTDLYVFERTERAVRSTLAQLEWILYQCGRRELASVLAYVKIDVSPMPADLATTLLKQGKQRELTLLFQEPNLYFTESEFCFWPILDWAENQGFMECRCAAGEGQALHGYYQARDRRESPPPWWRWLPERS